MLATYPMANPASEHPIKARVGDTPRPRPVLIRAASINPSKPPARLAIRRVFILTYQIGVEPLEGARRYGVQATPEVT